MITQSVIAASVSSDTRAFTSPSSEVATGAKAAPPAFLTLFDERCSASVQQQTDARGDDAKVLTTEEDIDDTSVVVELNAPLAALDNPAAMTLLLQTETHTDGRNYSDDRKKKSLPSVSSDGVLQALYAMLPGHNVHQPQDTAENTAPQEVAGEQGLSSALRENPIVDSALSQGFDASDADKPQENAISVPGLSAVDEKNSENLLFPSLRSHRTLSQQEKDNTVAHASLDEVPQTISNEEPQKKPVSQTPPLSAVFAGVSQMPSPSLSPSALTPATPQLHAPLGSPDWQQALGKQVLMFSRNGQHNAELRLHPEELGAIQINLKLDNDHAQLRVISGHCQVRSALEAAMPHLRNALAESGITLSQSSVSSDAFAQHQTFKEQQNFGGGRHADHLAAGDNSDDKDSHITLIDTPASLQTDASGNRRVDTYA